ncbi:MAG: CerR family C-terminal domain-containing protein [Pirellulaceae bacterium]|nr:CerR family C-terminal domain-containing protein [Pirellulaceae bacterium]
MTDSTRERILQAAGRVFADKGFQAATVRDICQEAEVNIAAVNYYFGEKQQLYVEAVRRARELRIAQVPFPKRAADSPPAERLRDFVHVIARRMLGTDGEPWQVRLMLREILSPTRACEEMVEDYFRPQFERLLGILAELLPDDTPEYRLRQIGFSVIGQCLFHRVAGEVVQMLTPPDEYRAHYQPEQIADHVCGLVFAALDNLSTHSAPRT